MVGRGILILCAWAAAAEDYTQWSYYRDLALNTTASGANIASTVTRIPILVRLEAAQADVFSGSKGRGADLRFSRRGLPLPYQIEHWDSAGRSAAVWVLLDTARGNDAAQALRMHWGRAGAVDSSDGPAVFSQANGFRGVWHLAGSGNPLDATANGITGNNVGTTATAGVIGGGRTFGGSNPDNNTANGAQYIALGDPAPLNITSGPVTLEAWVRWRNIRPLAGTSFWRNIVGRMSSPEVYLRVHGSCGSAGDGCRYHAGISGNSDANSAFSPPIASAYADSNAWVHLAGVFQDSTWRLYRNGIQVGSTSGVSGPTGSTGGWYIGAYNPASAIHFRYWSGDMDEVRISAAGRGAAWIRLSYETQKPGANCLVLGSTRLAPPSALTYGTNPAVYASGAAIQPNVPAYFGIVDSFTVSPALPAGLSLSRATGVLSGTPTSSAAAAEYTVTASNNAGSAEIRLNIAVTASTTAPANLAYSRNPAVYALNSPIEPNVPSHTGGAPDHYRVNPALPSGLALDSATGMLTGTPSVASPGAVYTVTAGNAAGSASVALTIEVRLEPPSDLAYPQNPARYHQGEDIAPNIPTVRGAVSAFAVTPPLPAGLLLDETSGMIWGRPASTASAADYVVTASNAAGSVSDTLRLEVVGPVSNRGPAGTRILVFRARGSAPVEFQFAEPEFFGRLRLEDTRGNRIWERNLPGSTPLEIEWNGGRRAGGIYILSLIPEKGQGAARVQRKFLFLAP